MKTVIYAQQALDLLSPIPEDDFIKFKFTDNLSKCCTLGHLSRICSDNPENYSMENCEKLDMDFISKISDFVYKCELDVKGIVDVNDFSYKGKTTSKSRAIQFFTDMAKAGY